MNKKQLIDALSLVEDDSEIMILDGSNGGGIPRAINFGPVSRTVSNADAQETDDCETLVGKSVVCLGYGCY